MNAWNTGPQTGDGAANEHPPTERYVMRLYVTGITPNSVCAIRNTRAICEAYLPGNYDLEIVDLFSEPGRAREGQIFASPTLVKLHPEPIRLLVGTMEDRTRVLASLDLL